MVTNGNFFASYSTTAFCVTSVGSPLGKDKKKVTSSIMCSEIFAICVGLAAEDNIIHCPLLEIPLKVTDILSNL